MVSGFTQIVAVIGHPITQVKSPDNFNHYFASQNMDKVMIPVDIAPEAVAAYLNALRGWQNMTGDAVKAELLASEGRESGDSEGEKVEK